MKGKLNRANIWKLRKKIVKRYGKYGRKYGKDMKNTEETQVE
jgi:hypothetical protein